MNLDIMFKSKNPKSFIAVFRHAEEKADFEKLRKIVTKAWNNAYLEESDWKKDEEFYKPSVRYNTLNYNRSAVKEGRVVGMQDITDWDKTYEVLGNTVFFKNERTYATEAFITALIHEAVEANLITWISSKDVLERARKKIERNGGDVINTDVIFWIP